MESPDLEFGKLVLSVQSLRFKQTLRMIFSFPKHAGVEESSRKRHLSVYIQSLQPTTQEERTLSVYIQSLQQTIQEEKSLAVYIQSLQSIKNTTYTNQEQKLPQHHHQRPKNKIHTPENLTNSPSAANPSNSPQPERQSRRPPA